FASPGRPGFAFIESRSLRCEPAGQDTRPFPSSTECTLRADVEQKHRIDNIGYLERIGPCFPAMQNARVVCGTTRCCNNHRASAGRGRPPSVPLTDTKRHSS